MGRKASTRKRQKRSYRNLKALRKNINKQLEQILERQAASLRALERFEQRIDEQLEQLSERHAASLRKLTV